MRRRGYSLMEVLVAAVIGMMVLGSVVSIFFTTQKMARSGDLSSALAEASIALSKFHLDLLQAVARPDPDGSRVILASKQAAQWVQAEIKPDGSLGGKLIVYHRQKTAAANWRLMRRRDGKDEALPGVYSNIRFQGVNANGGPFVRVTLHVLARDATAVGERGGADEAVLTCLVRAKPADMLGSPMFDWSSLDEILNVKPLVGDLGF